MCSHRLHLEPVPLALARPFEPWLLCAERVGARARFVVGQRTRAGGIQKRRRAVWAASRVEAKNRWEVRVVREPEARRLSYATRAASPAGGLFFRLSGCR
jgi:hypothetical protein